MAGKASPADKRASLGDLGLRAEGGQRVSILGLAVDSREVGPGFLFAALPGSKVHGAEFAETAIERGASAILTDAEGAALLRTKAHAAGIAIVVAEDPRQTLAKAAALWFGAQPATAVAVTGTNGKTSVSTFCRQIWEDMGEKAVNIGTTGVEGAWTYPLRHTTPEPITLHKVMAEAAKAGVTHMAMEASSHGLDQRRLDGVQLAAAAFTNFTQDHLDYHQTFGAYFAAKMGLFTRVLPPEGTAVVNLDDPRGAEEAEIARAAGHPVITVGHGEGADLCLAGQHFDATGQTLRLVYEGKPWVVRLKLVGGFQASNVAVAAALAIGAGSDPDEVFHALARLTTVRGRMQLAATRKNGAAVYVDYAHTPDAVETALKAIRPHVLGRIIAIVGAGGDRDRGKRPLMGSAAARCADHVIVTDDNPRSEDPASIRAAVMAGAREAGGEARIEEVGDRAKAILIGVDALGPGDALLICGKGHESVQVIGDQTLPFDDAEQASIAVAALEGTI